MASASPALQHKIAKARANAHADLPLVRRCARVVLAAVSEGEDLAGARAELKNAHGAQWSLVTALQLLSGRRGQFAAECAGRQERASLYLAHLIAQFVCNAQALGAVSRLGAAELQRFREQAEEYVRSQEP